MLDTSTTSYESVIHKKLTGRLTLSPELLSFSSSADNHFSLQIPWTQIHKHQVSPPTYPKSLWKIITSSNGPLTFQLASRPDLERLRQDASDKLQRSKHNSQNTQPTDANSNNDNDPTSLAVTRASLLAANPALRKQHDYLVTDTHTLDEEDFWKTHADLLEEAQARMVGMTKAGTSSLLQSHLVLEGRKVTLGVEEMRQIFILYPAVHRAYEEKVPLELSDEQFWRKYLESEYFHRDRGRLGAASGNTKGDGSSNSSKSKSKMSLQDQEARAAVVGTDDLFSRYEQKRLEQELKDQQQMERPKRKWGPHLGLGQFDLAATYETPRSRVLEPRDSFPLKDEEETKGSKVIQKYNRHWAMVLHPEDAVAGSDLMEVAHKSIQDRQDDDAKAGGGVDAEMQRLVGYAKATSENANHALGIGIDDDDCEYEQLTLKNIEAYYAGRPSAGTSTTNDEETRKKHRLFANSVVGQVNALVSKAKAARRENKSIQLDDAFPPPQLGKDLLAALTNKMAKDSQTDADALEVVNALPEDFKKRLHYYFRRTSELLRHFFGLRRLADSKDVAYNQKLQKIVGGLETVYREMDEMRKELAGTGETAETMNKMCLQIMDQLDWAFKLHGESRGTGGTGGGGGGFVTIEEF